MVEPFPFQRPAHLAFLPLVSSLSDSCAAGLPPNGSIE
jgi:hypothetical protein